MAGVGRAGPQIVDGRLGGACAAVNGISDEWEQALCPHARHLRREHSHLRVTVDRCWLR